MGCQAFLPHLSGLRGSGCDPCESEPFQCILGQKVCSWITLGKGSSSEVKQGLGHLYVGTGQTSLVDTEGVGQCCKMQEEVISDAVDERKLQRREPARNGHMEVWKLD